MIRKYTPWGLYDRRNTMEEKKVCPGCCHKTKDRPEKEYKDLMNRLSRIEGQVRGVRRMVEEGALNSFNKVLLANHIRTCVADDIRDGKDETIDELVTTLQKLMR